MNKVFLLFVLVFLSCSQSEKKVETKSTPPLGSEAKVSDATATSDLPDLAIKLDTGVSTNAKEFDGKTILILFQPDCDHCQREAVDFKKHIEFFKEYQLYFISAASMEEVFKFAEEYELKSFPNVHWGTTTVQSVLSSLGPIEAPSVYIYSKDKKLVKHFNGESPVEEMINLL